MTRQSKQKLESKELDINPESKYESPRLRLAKTYKGFTLAEVLITLVVIGIIAAITVPVMMTNYRKAETISKLKKIYSSYTNAIKLAEVEQGIPSPDWNFSISTKDFYNQYLSKHLNSPSCDNCLGKLNDGTTLYGYGRMWGCQIFHFDINGDKKPNEYGKDKFFLPLITSRKMVDKGAKPLETITNILLIEANYGPNASSRETILSNCKTGRMSCLELIMHDGWEIKDDYPYKI